MNSKRLTVMIGYSEFVAICHVDDPKNFGGFRVEADGLYVVMPDADAILTPRERAAVTWHPTGNLDKPALSLPCTLGQLRVFVADAGLLGCVDESEVDVLLRAAAVPAADGDESSGVGNALIVGTGGTTKPGWVQQARSMGEAWMLAEEKRTGTRPTVEQIAKHLEGELSTRNIRGARGKFLDWETIKREALTGITGRKKGDNFKNVMGNPHRRRESPIAKAK